MGSRKDVPDECESQFCTDEPELALHYRKPYDKVYYCSWHAGVKATDPKVTEITQL